MTITTAMMIPLAPKEDPLVAGGAECTSVVVMVWDEAAIVVEWLAGNAVVGEWDKTTLWLELRNTSGVLVMEGVRNEWDVGPLWSPMGSREAVLPTDISRNFEDRGAELKE